MKKNKKIETKYNHLIKAMKKNFRVIFIFTNYNHHKTYNYID